LTILVKPTAGSVKNIHKVLSRMEQQSNLIMLHPDVAKINTTQPSKRNTVRILLYVQHRMDCSKRFI